MTVAPTLTAAADWCSRNPFATYDPLRSLIGFHRSNHTRRLVRKPNQIGGTFAAAWESWAHLVGRHRYRPDVRPSRGMVLVADLTNTYPEVSEKLRAVAPMDLLDPACRYVEGKGWYTNGKRLIRSRAGHTMIFRSGEGGGLGAESASVGWLWIDEPPTKAKFGGALSRVARAMGPAWMTFTPIGRPVDWLRLHIEGDKARKIAPREEWEQHRPHLTEQDCTTVGGVIIRSAESIGVQIAGYTRGEINQRVYAEWEGMSEDRAFFAFNDDCVREEAPWPDARGDQEVHMSFDHGESLSQVGLVARVQMEPSRCVHITAEYVAPHATTEEEDAVGALAMLAEDGLRLDHVDRAVGDINSSGKAGGGRSINARLSEALNSAAGFPDVLVPVQNASKGRVSVGVRAINLAMMRKELFIHPRCKRLIAAIQMWDGKPATEHIKHLPDALRYLAVPLLEPADDQGVPSIAISA